MFLNKYDENHITVCLVSSVENYVLYADVG